MTSDKENVLEKAKLACGRYRLVMMTCGYVESNTTSWLIFTTHDGHFATAAEAVIELALDMYAKFEEDVLSTEYVFHKDCCKVEIAGNVAAVFCSKCGTRIKVKEFDPEEFMEYVRSLHSTTCDSYGESEGTANRSFAFWPWRANEIIGAAKDEVVMIAENGEVVLLHALYDARSDLKMLDENVVEAGDNWRSSDWDDVRQKGTNFSY